MAVKIANTVVIADDRELQNITSASDSVTSATIQDAVRQRNNKIEIQDTSGTPIHTLYGGS